MKSLPRTWHIIVTEKNIKDVKHIAGRYGISEMNIYTGTVFGKYEWLGDHNITFYGPGVFTSYTHGDAETENFSFGKRISDRIFMRHFFKKKSLNDE